MIQVLLDAGANINAKDDETSQTPLHFSLSPEDSHPETARLLISRGADVNARSKLGSTPLIFAVCNSDQVKVVSNLIANGADVNLADNDGHSPLYWARSNTSAFLPSAIVDLLIQHGAK